MLAATPMRSSDVVALMVGMAIALAVLYWHHGIASALSRPHGRAQAGMQAMTRLALIWLAGGGAVAMALTLLGVVAERPGPYPGGIATKAVAIAGLAAFVVIVVVRVIPGLRGRRRED